MNIQVERGIEREEYPGAEITMPSLSSPCCPHLHVFTNVEVCQTPYFGDFYGGFLMQA